MRLDGSGEDWARLRRRWTSIASWALLAAFVVYVMLLPGAPNPAALASDLREAAQQGDLAALERAIAQGAAIDAADDSGATALLSAARAGQTAAAKRLYSLGARVDRRARVLGTPLIQAAVNGHEQTVRLLLDAGADPNIVNEYGNDALTFAIFSPDPAVVRALLERGAEVSPMHLKLCAQCGDPRITELLKSASEKRSRRGSNLQPSAPETTE